MRNLQFILLIISFNLAIINASFEKYNQSNIADAGRQQVFNKFGAILHTENVSNIRSEECLKTKVSPYFDARVDSVPQKCYKSALPKDCAEATQCTQLSGIYKIQVLQFSNDPFYVACDAVTEDGEWLVIQKRQDDSVNFERTWLEYEHGFGDIEGEFFIGLEKLHALTNFYGPQELLVVMEDNNYTAAYAKYDSFAIGNAEEEYKLKRIGKYSGTAGNSLQNGVGMMFTTKDRDNDLTPEHNCAVWFTGAWWYKSCHDSNLNGKYGDNTFGKGINWYHFRGARLSLRYVKMMIRRSRNI